MSRTLEQIKLDHERIHTIKTHILATHPVTWEQIMSRRKPKPIADARAEAMAMIRDRLRWSYPMIGRYFGKDHSTVMYAVEQHNRKREKA